jgi:hypothetical protein
MKSKFINVLFFTVGAAIGSAVTWKVVKTKYDRLIQEEIDSVKEAFVEVYGEHKADMDEEIPEEEEDEDPSEGVHQIDWSELEDLDEEEEYTPTKEDLLEYESLVHNYHDEKGGAHEVKKEPYVIAPYDFGELDDYSTIELTYYMDGILEDDEYHIVTDADSLIGPKALTTFGEYEDDAVFVRNDYLRTDFQILKDYRTYDEAKHIGPDRVD